MMEEYLLDVKLQNVIHNKLFHQMENVKIVKKEQFQEQISMVYSLIVNKSHYHHPLFNHHKLFNLHQLFNHHQSNKHALEDSFWPQTGNAKTVAHMKFLNFQQMVYLIHVLLPNVIQNNLFCQMGFV